METPSKPLPVIGTGILTNGHGFYAVPSSSDPTRCYLVEQWPAKLECACKDHYFRHRRCKHIMAVTAHKQKLHLEEADTASKCDETETAETRAGRPRIYATRSQERFSLLKH